MNVVQRLMARANPENPATPLSNPAAWLWNAWGADKTTAGVRVNEKKALQVMAVFAAVRVLAESVASLPLILYRRGPDGRGKFRATDDPRYHLMHDAAGPFMSSYVWRETTVAHAALWGNGVSEIEWGADGYPKALWPLLPDRTEAKLNEKDQLVYRTRVDHRWVPLKAGQVFHVPALSLDGFWGLSPIQVARRTLGLAIAQEEFASEWFGNGSQPSGVLQTDKKLSEEAAKRISSDWERQHSGHGNRHRMVVLEQGLQWEQIGMPPGDAQLLEQRKFSISEIARLYRVPPHMIGDLERSTHNNIEHQGMEFLKYTLLSWLVRIELEANRKLLGPSERGELFFEFMIEGFLRGDLKTRAEAFKIMRDGGTLTANEWRAYENMNPIDEDYGDGYGDEYLVPLNMLPASQLTALPSVQDLPEEDDDPEDGPEDDPESPGDDGDPDPPDDPTPDDDGQGARQILGAPGLALMQARRRRSASARRRIQQAHMKVVEDAGRRIVRREVEAVSAAVKRELGKRGLPEFDSWVENFYEDHIGYTSRTLGGVLTGYAELIRGEASDEIGLSTAAIAAFDEFVTQYVSSSARREVGASVGQLRQIVGSHATDPEDVLRDALLQRLEQWETRRPGKLALTETVTMAGAVSRETYRQGGVIRLQWVAFGDTCPLCSEIDGRIVGIEAPFLGSDEELNPGGDVAPLRNSRPTFHPQLHGGCDCGITSA